MLELTGKCCSGMEAIEFMEMLPDVIEEDVKTEEFCNEYEAALNRFRYEVAKGIGAKKKVIKAKSRRYQDFQYCGKCGFGAGEPSHKYCPNCGTKYLYGIEKRNVSQRVEDDIIPGQMSFEEFPEITPDT